jgi:hypothetical protein
VDIADLPIKRAELFAAVLAAPLGAALTTATEQKPMTTAASRVALETREKSKRLIM